MAVMLKKAQGIVTEPLDVGDGKFSLVDVIAPPEQAPVSAGICEIWASRRVRVRQRLRGVLRARGQGDVDRKRHPTQLRRRRRALTPAAGGSQGLLGLAVPRQVLLRHVSAVAVSGTSTSTGIR